VVRCRIVVWKCGLERLAVVLVAVDVVVFPLDMTAGRDRIHVVEVLLSILEALIAMRTPDESILVEG
jgi:hypothetical protein